MKMRRLLACMMALLLSTSLPVTALADTYDLAEGSVSVNASESGQTVTHKEETRPDSAPVITQSGSKETSTANTVTITAEKNTSANVTLDGVNISADGAAIQTSGEGKVVIELDGNNTVQSGEGHAGVEKNNSGYLTITDKNGEAGSLTATGGAGGAGIGGGAKGTGSDIAISDGMDGVGIGGGEGGNGSNIPISGGTAGSSGSTGGVGIGGGEGGNGSNIPISGGTVAARDGTGGVGGGVSGNGSKIAISGGTVTAKGGENAAGIGGGVNGNGSNIIISGGTVDAIGGDAPSYETGDGIVKGEGGGAGIGGGSYGTGRNIFIQDDAVVMATGKGNAADIGDGHPKDSTRKQRDRVDVSYLTPSGSVNGVHGSYNPDANDGDADETDDGHHDFSTGQILNNGYTKGSRELKELLKLTDSNGHYLPCELLVKGDEFIFTVAANNATLTGDRDALQSLKDQGVGKTVLETNRMTVSVSNDLLMKITNDGESFQLSTDDTSFSLTTTDNSHKKIFGVNLTTDGTQEEHQIGNGTQEKQQNTNGQLVYKTEVRLQNDDSLNSSLQFVSTSDKATLILSGGSLQILKEQGIGSTALTAGDLTIGFENSEVMEKVVTALASGDLTIDSENGGVVKKTDANVEHRLGHASVILKNNGGQNDNAMGIIHGSQITDNHYIIDISDSLLQQAGRSIIQQQTNGPTLSLLG